MQSSEAGPAAEHRMVTWGEMGREVLSAYNRPVCFAVFLSAGFIIVHSPAPNGPVTASCHIVHRTCFVPGGPARLAGFCSRASSCHVFRFS